MSHFVSQRDENTMAKYFRNQLKKQNAREECTALETGNVLPFI